jgi:hypothetical protein
MGISTVESSSNSAGKGSSIFASARFDVDCNKTGIDLGCCERSIFTRTGLSTGTAVLLLTIRCLIVEKLNESASYQFKSPHMLQATTYERFPLDNRLLNGFEAAKEPYELGAFNFRVGQFRFQHLQ